jgi:hypothetical protein
MAAVVITCPVGKAPRLSSLAAARHIGYHPGMTPIGLASWVLNGAERFAGIWKRIGEEDRPVVKVGLGSDELVGLIDEYAAEGLGLSAVSAWVGKDGERFAGIWKLTDEDDRPVVKVGLGAHDLIGLIDEYAAKGLGLSAVSAWVGKDGERFIGIWKRTKVEVVGQIGLNREMFSIIADVLARVALAYMKVPGTPFSTPDEFVVKDGVLEFFTDNPEISVPIELDFETVDWSPDPVPQEVQSSLHAWVMTNGKLGMQTWLDPGQSPMGAVEVDGELQPIEKQSWSAPSSFEASIERVSLGYRALNVRAFTQGAHYQTVNNYNLRARLSDMALLVPVEVAYFAVEGVTAPGFAGKSRIVFDGQSELGDAYTTSWSGQIRYFARQWLAQAPSLRTDDLEALEAPDSIFRQANIALRFRSYEEFQVERRQTAPSPGDYADDRSAFKLNRNLFAQRVSDESRPDALRIVLMERVAPTESLIVGVSPVGTGYAGIGKNDFARFYLAHEIGHAGGLPHVDDSSNLMNETPSAVKLTEAQILKLRSWAAGFRNQWT